MRLTPTRSWDVLWPLVLVVASGALGAAVLRDSPEVAVITLVGAATAIHSGLAKKASA